MGRPKGVFKPPPGTYTGTTQEWQALSSTQRFNMRNPGQSAAYSKAHYKNNAVLVATVRKDYRENNLVQITAYQQAYRETNRDKLNAQQLVHYHANSQVISIQNQQRRIEKNKEFREMFGDDGIIP